MPSEHLIRLRGSWDWQVSGGAAGLPARITLPTAWPTGLASPFRLLRRFGRPPIDPDREAVDLRLDDVAGLTKVWLNDRLIASPPPGIGSLCLALDEPLGARNLLVLEVDPARWAGPAEGATGETAWGSIALAIRRTG